MLEASQNEDNCFVTLTYADKALPRMGNLRGVWTGDVPLATLYPKDLQNFLKRLRSQLVELSNVIGKNQAQRIRYYACGEYGETTERPHFHVAFFGLGTCFYGNTRTGPRRIHCCARCDQLSAAWKLGRVHVGTLTADSAAYVAGYVTKKMTTDDDRSMLKGRHPEFARMSNRPGIGQSAMHEVASQLMRFNLDTSQPDVPSALRHGSRVLPLGRYLHRSLRELVGHEKETPEAVKAKMAEELRPVREAAFALSVSLKHAVKERHKAKVDRVIARNRIFKRRTQI